MHRAVLATTVLLALLGACGDEPRVADRPPDPPREEGHPESRAPEEPGPTVRFHARDASTGAPVAATFVLRDEDGADIAKSAAGEFKESVLADARRVVVLADGFDILDQRMHGADTPYDLSPASKQATLFCRAEDRVPLIVQWVVPRVGREGIYSAAVSRQIELADAEVTVPVAEGAELQVLVDLGRPRTDRRIMWPAFVACESGKRYEWHVEHPRTVRVTNLPRGASRIVVLPASWQSGLNEPNRVDGHLDRDAFEPWDVPAAGNTCEFTAPHVPLHLFVEAPDGWEYLRVARSESTVGLESREAPGNKELTVSPDLTRDAGALAIIPGHLGLHESTSLLQHLRYDKTPPWVETLGSSSRPGALPVHSTYTVVSRSRGIAHASVSAENQLTGAYFAGAIRLVGPSGSKLQGSIVVHDQPRGTGAVRSGYLGSPSFSRKISHGSRYLVSGLPPGLYKLDGQIEVIVGEKAKSIRLRRRVIVREGVTELPLVGAR